MTYIGYCLLLISSIVSKPQFDDFILFFKFISVPNIRMTRNFNCFNTSKNSCNNYYYHI